MISPISGNDPPVHNPIDQAGDKRMVTTHPHKVADQRHSIETKGDNVELSRIFPKSGP